MTILRLFLVALVALVVGVLGAFLFNFSVLPYMLASAYFEDFQFVKDFKQGKIVVNPKETIYIQENTALEGAATRVAASVVIVHHGAVTKSGLVLTSDGLVATTAGSISMRSQIALRIAGETLPARVITLDVKNNLALLKIEKTGLQTVPFANIDNIKLGQRVFLLSAGQKGEEGLLLNEGIIRQIGQDAVLTNMKERQEAQGSPLFSVIGELVGLNAIDKDGNISAVPVNKVQELLGL